MDTAGTAVTSLCHACMHECITIIAGIVDNTDALDLTTFACITIAAGIVDNREASNLIKQHFDVGMHEVQSALQCRDPIQHSVVTNS